MVGALGQSFRRPEILLHGRSASKKLKNFTKNKGRRDSRTKKSAGRRDSGKKNRLASGIREKKSAGGIRENISAGGIRKIFSDGRQDSENNFGRKKRSVSQMKDQVMTMKTHTESSKSELSLGTFWVRKAVFENF